jgi:hypothetical protein
MKRSESGKKQLPGPLLLQVTCDPAAAVRACSVLSSGGCDGDARSSRALVDAYET